MHLFLNSCSISSQCLFPLIFVCLSHSKAVPHRYDLLNQSIRKRRYFTALAVPEKQELIFRKRQGPGQPNRIYVKLPKETIHYTELLDTRIQIRPDFRDKLIKQLKGTFGKYYDYHHRDIAANEVDYLNVEDPDVFSHRAWELEYQRKQEIRRNQPARTKKKSYDIEL